MKRLATNDHDARTPALRPLQGIALAGLALCAATLAAHAQIVTPKLISIPVLIHDHRGALISGLSTADVTLTDNTHPQTILSFTQDNSLPLALGLLAQTGPGQEHFLNEEKHASEAFLAVMLSRSSRPADSDKNVSRKVTNFVIQFHEDVDLLEEPSPSTNKLHQAIDQIGRAEFAGDSNQESNFGATETSKKNKNAGAKLYDAIYLAAHAVLARENGRKAILVFTDGLDRGSITSLNGAIEAAQRAGVAVYAIYQKPARATQSPFGRFPKNHTTPSSPYPGGLPGYPEGLPSGSTGSDTGSEAPPPPATISPKDAQRLLAELCARTGGEMFDADHMSLHAIFTIITAQMNSAYLLRYQPTNDESGFHHLRLSLKQHGLIVQMSEGYWRGQD